MQKTQRFTYRTFGELQQEIARRNLELPTSEDLFILSRPARFGRLTLPNRLSVHPMEGCDGMPDGSPDGLTVRRYQRFAAGGAGLLWMEACAVVPQGRANPRQLWIHRGNVSTFAHMLRLAREAAAKAGGPPPVFVLQLTHSGRYSRPGPKPAPIIAQHNPVLDPRHGLAPDHPLITDEELDRLQDDFVLGAELAAEAGFDAVDVKSCHRYLCSELLSSHNREGRYGGSFENRTRFLREVSQKIRAAVGDRLEVTCRMNIYDAIPYPCGWGVDRDDATKPDLTDPLRLIGELKAMGFGGMNLTVANPYFNPYINRPADWMVAHMPDAPEHPLVGVARLLGLVRDVQKAYPDLCIVGTGYSWLRQYYPYFAAGAIEKGWVSVAGLGRGAFAYPDFARDILRGGRMDPAKVCVACSSCTQIMRDGGRSGCVVRDAEVYGPIFRLGRDLDPKTLEELASRCRGCADASCAAACPAHVDVPGFLGALAEGHEREAYRILSRNNVLPGICGAVCPVEVQCQSACIQNCLSGSPVPIARIQKNLSLLAIANGWAAVEVPAVATGKRVAVVGAGPGGLAAAAGLLRAGHAVTVIDRAPQAGGKLMGTIPPTRLRPEDAEAEIRAIFASVGRAYLPDAKPPTVPESRASTRTGPYGSPDLQSARLQWRLGKAMGKDFKLDDVLAEGFDAVVLAMGLGNGGSIAAGDGARPAGVLDAGAFLAHMNRNPEHACPPRVAVLGGGNTAADAAVCAARRGAKDVYLVYRRSYQQMPAWPKERDETLHAGVHLMLLCQPLGYVTGDGGRLTGLRVQRTELGEADDKGRRRPVPAKGGEFTLDIDLAVEALGEQMDPLPEGALAGVDRTKDGLIVVNPQTQAASRQGVWAVGDCANGGTTVVQAVAEGLRAARAVSEFLGVGPR
jgi:NADPH-dependent glutamate synthase beta subunit-like oxidoreductase/2,4-dienoyl-CoA reductase-like NADH-dependent reductase (Old Yellow Enzyme family)